MSRVEEGLYAWLTASPEIEALVDDRIYPDRAPQGVVRPYVTFFVVATEPALHLTAGAGVTSSQVQLDIWADDNATRRSIADALFARLHGYVGDMPPLYAQQVRFGGPTNSHERPNDAGEVGTFRGRCDVTIWHDEIVPVFT